MTRSERIAWTCAKAAELRRGRALAKEFFSQPWKPNPMLALALSLNEALGGAMPYLGLDEIADAIDADIEAQKRELAAKRLERTSQKGKRR